MAYKLENISKRSNIIINEQTITYGETMTVEHLDDKVKRLVELDMIKAEPIIINRIEVSQKVFTPIELENIKKTKEELIEIFYKFHINLPLEQWELNRIVWFYKNVSPISLLPESTKDFLDEVKDGEELIEVLTNQIYPSLVENHFFK